jgi:hypothetical protein
VDLLRLRTVGEVGGEGQRGGRSRRTEGGRRARGTTTGDASLASEAQVKRRMG